MTAEEIDRFMASDFPEAAGFAEIEAIEETKVRVRIPYDPSYLRPGGSISGPILMTAADTAMFYLVLATIGPAGGSVTQHLAIDFLRRPAPADVLAEAEMLRLGRRSAVGRVLLFSRGEDAPVAHASVTYALGPAPT